MRHPSSVTALLLLSLPAAAQSWTTSNEITPARTYVGATSAGGQAFFAGGGHPFTSFSDAVDVYDATVGPPTDPAAWSAATLSQARAGVAATAVGGKVLFAGGAYQGFGLPVSDVVDVYDLASGTWSVASLSEARTEDAATSVAGHALFAGGNPNDLGDPGPPSARIDVYTAATDSWSQATLAVPRLAVKATSVGPYALFAGGNTFTFGSASDVVEVYDSTVGPPTDPAAWSIAHLSQPRAVGAATSAGGKAFFAGGSAEVAPGVFETVATVDVYDSCVGPPSDPGAWSVTYLSTPRVFLAAASQGDEALFAGGVRFFSDGSSTYYDVVDVFDAATNTWSYESLSYACLPTGTAVGEYALFGGGHDQNWVYAPYDVVDARRAKVGHWYVDALAAAPGSGTPTEPFPTIQAAIDAAAAGDTVHVAPGTYPEHLVVDDDLTLVGTCGRDATTLVRDFSMSVPLITSTDAALHLVGFTLRNGYASQGGGLFVDGGDVLIENCRFLFCRAGLGMSSGAGGAIFVAAGNLEVRWTAFEQNTAAGEGQGGAIYGSPLVHGCEFFRNRAEGSTFQRGAGAIHGNPRIENSVFDRNSGRGCLHPLDASPTEIFNSTFADNDGYLMMTGSVVRNSIFWAHGSAGISLGGPGQTLDVQYCIVDGGHPGVGNLDVYPGFVAPLTSIAGLRLAAGSPAIDAGNNAEVPAGTLADVFGRPRFRDDPDTPDTGVGPAPVVDIGAFEYKRPERRLLPAPAGGPRSGGRIER